MLIEQPDGTVLEVKVVRLHGSMAQALWSRACKRMLRRIGERAERQAFNSSHEKIDKWIKKASSIAVSQRKRITRNRLAPGRKKKTSQTWYTSCRLMHRQWIMHERRAIRDKANWRDWANNVASNHRKRIAERYEDNR